MTTIGPSPGWEPDMQRHGRQEMAARLRDQGPAAAAEYAATFEQEANGWLEHQGFATGFVFDPIPLPALS